MAVVSTERREPSLNSILIFILMLLIGCNASRDDILNSTDISFKTFNGVLLYNDQPYSGRVFTLLPESRDTVEIAGYHHGREHGVWRKLYSNGMLKERREFKDGLKTGTYTAWWENGRKKLEYRYKEDEYEGICREWNGEGTLIREMHYARGHEQGAQKMFYDNGKVRSNYVIVNGRRYGLLGTKNCVNASDSVFKN